MRLDNISVTNIGAPAAGQSGAAPPRPLEVGDSVEARVISNENGAVTLKTADGETIRARLEAGVDLPVGTEATLVVSEKAGGVIYMKLAPEMLEGGAQPSKPDPEASSFAKQLRSLNLPVNSQTINNMRALVTRYPELTPGQAAFLAANSMTVEPSLLDAATALLSGEADTAAMLDKLAELLTRALDAPGREALPGTVPADDAGPVELLARALEQAGGEMRQAPQLTMREWITAFMANEAALAAGTTEGQSMPELPQSIMRQPGRPGFETPAQPADTAAPAQPAGTQAPEQAPDVRTLPQQPGAQQPSQTDQPGEARPLSPGETPPQALHSAGQGAQAQAAREGAGLSERGAVIKMLAQMPSFEGMSDRALGQIAGFLERLVQTETAGGETREASKSLTRLLDELFVRPEGDGRDIRRAREELYVRLSYLREVISRSGMRDSQALVERTERLMEHAKLMSDVEQFVYVQIPVKNGRDTTTAQLYVFRRDRGGSKRIDPENARILLALDLTSMGHLEAFIEVKGKEVSLQLEVGSEGVKAAFMQDTARLSELISEAGYKFSNAAVSLKKSETTLETALLSLLSFERRTAAGINFTI